MKKQFILLAAGLLISACTWVELSEEGKAIRIVGIDDVETCKKLGKVMVSLKDQIAGFDRNQDKVKREMENLARNSAHELFKGEADTLVPVSKIKKGKQTFDVYKCVNPDVIE